MADKQITMSPNVKDISEINNADPTPWNNNTPAIDIRYGGQWGFLPTIGDVVDGKVIHAYMSNQRYKNMDVIPVVLQTPRIFDLFPNSKYYHQAVKALFEKRARVIEGLNSSITWEVGETEVGIEGAVLEEVTNATRERTNISLTVDEVVGNAIEKLIDLWGRYGLMDPDTKGPLITTLPGAEKIKILTADWYSATVLFIKPDPLYRYPTHAWLVSNLFPKSNPEITGKKEKKAAKEFKEMSIEFGGLALPPTNKNVMELAAKTLDSLKLYAHTPDNILLPAKEVDAVLKGANDVDIYYEKSGMASGTSSNG